MSFLKKVTSVVNNPLVQTGLTVASAAGVPGVALAQGALNGALKPSGPTPALFGAVDGQEILETVKAQDQRISAIEEVLVAKGLAER